MAAVVVAQCAALMLVCLLIGDNGWDDGAITVAFARTFARHGRVALTPRSEVVEGFSSVSWFALNSLAGLARPSYRAALLISQTLSVLSIAACTALLARSCALLGLGRLCSALTVIGFAVWGCSFSEAGNGMEMGLLAAACLLIINGLLSSELRLLPLGAGVVLAMATRFEAALYVGLLGLSVFSVPGRRAFWAIVATSLVAVALLSAWRLATFSDFLPNTFWAKRWPPYAGFSAGDRLAGGLELPSLFLVPILALGIAGLSAFRPAAGPRPDAGSSLARALRGRRRAIGILAAPLLGAVVMGVVTGRHWGYHGRMPYFAVPPTLLLLALLFSHWIEARRTAFRAVVAVGSLASAVITSLVGFPFGALDAARKGGTFGVTPHTYAESGRVFRRFAAAAEVEHAAILTSDVGGLSLCCDEFKIVDLAFLCNGKLAHHGPGNDGEVLAQVVDAESPDLVEAHWKWASLPKLYDLPGFRAHYAPALGGGTKLWIRRDVAAGIERKGGGCWLDPRREDVKVALQAHRYSRTDLPYDRTSFDRAGGIFALKQAEPNGVSLCDVPVPVVPGGGPTSAPGW